MSWFLADTVYIRSCQADGDTLFLFNYRSDRMREISTVLGRLDKPVDVVIPKDIVRFLCTIVHICPNLRNWTAHYHHVSLQCRVPVPSRVSASSDDKRACRMALPKRHQASTHSRSAMRISWLTLSLLTKDRFVRAHRDRKVRAWHILLQWRCREVIRG